MGPEPARRTSIRVSAERAASGAPRRAALLLLVASLLASLVAPAAADPSIDAVVERQLDRSALERAREQERQLRAQLDADLARLDEIEMQVSLAVDEYNLAMEQLEEAEAQLAATRAELGQLQAELAALTALVAHHARRLHMLGGPGIELANLFVAGSVTDIGARQTTLRRVLDAQAVDLEQLQVLRTAVTGAEQRQADEQAVAEAQAVVVEAERVRVETLLAEVQDEIATLEARVTAAQAEVRTEQQQLDARAAELRAQEVARREEEARRAAAARAAAAQRERERQAATRTSAPSASAPAPSAPAANPPPARSSGQTAANVAIAQIGKPYGWGQNGPSRFDCSGLTSYAWRAAGVSIPRTSRQQAASLTRVSCSSPMPGDLRFFNNPVSHVAIYVGNGQMVEAPHTGALVRSRAVSSRTARFCARP